MTSGKRLPHNVICSGCGSEFETTSTKQNILCPACVIVRRIENRSIPRAKAILNSLRIMDIDALGDREIKVAEALCDFDKYPFQHDAMFNIALDLDMGFSELESLVYRLYRRFDIGGGNARRKFVDVYQRMKKENDEHTQSSGNDK